MKKNHYEAIVVGAGYGGVAIAAALAEKGLKVLIVDKNKTAGGKAMRVHRDGEIYDLWPIAGGPSEGSRFDDLIRLLGLSEDMIIAPDPVSEFVYHNQSGERQQLLLSALPIRNPLEMVKMFGSYGIKPWQLGGLIAMQLMALSIPPSLLHHLDNLSMKSLMEKFRFPRAVFSFNAVLMNLFFVVPIDRLPASEALRTLKEMAQGGGGRYHRHGYGYIAEQAAAYVQNRGGDYLSSTRVDQIIIEQGHACGISTEKGRYYAPMVISNAGLQPTVLKLVGSKNFSPDYVQWARALQPSCAFVGVRYHVKKAVFKYPMTVAFSDDSWWDQKHLQQSENGQWPEIPVVFVTVPSLYDRGLSQSSNQVALIGTLCSPDPDSPMNEEAIKRVENMAARLWPDLPENIVDRKVFGSKQVSGITRDSVVPGQGGECIGLGQLIGQCGQTKPNPRSPIPGLYYVGCDAGGHGIGTTQAVDSGFNVARMVLDDYQQLSSWFEHNLNSI